jgi:hypothetical protein
MKWFSFVATGLFTVTLLVGGTGCPSKEIPWREKGAKS